MNTEVKLSDDVLAFVDVGFGLSSLLQLPLSKGQKANISGKVNLKQSYKMILVKPKTNAAASELVSVSSRCKHVPP